MAEKPTIIPTARCGRRCERCSDERIATAKRCTLKNDAIHLYAMINNILQLKTTADNYHTHLRVCSTVGQWGNRKPYYAVIYQVQHKRFDYYNELVSQLYISITTISEKLQSLLFTIIDCQCKTK